jgi:hypothetical protein
MIARLLIDRAERWIGEDMSWIRDVAALGGRALRRLLGFQRFADYRRRASVELYTLARLGAIMAEDCGPCVRIVAKLGKSAGVDPELLRAGLRGGSGLTGDNDLAYRFGRAISAAEPEAAALGDMIEARLGRGVRTELAMAAAAARLVPAIKRGLGYAQSCALTRFEDL